MQSSVLDVRKIRTTCEDDLFFDLVGPFITGSKNRASPYRLIHFVPCDSRTAYAVYETDHNIVAVQFYLNGEQVAFADEEPVRFMSMDMVRLIKELGEVIIDGKPFVIDDMRFDIIDGTYGCQYMIIFNLKHNFEKER